MSHTKNASVGFADTKFIYAAQFLVAVAKNSDRKKCVNKNIDR